MFPPPDDSRATARGDRRRRRDRLTSQFAELQCDLGGLAYEMAIRDHFRVDVLVCGATRLSAVTADLAEIERRMHLGAAAPSRAAPRQAGPAILRLTTLGLRMRVTKRRLAAGIASAGIAATALSPAASSAQTTVAATPPAAPSAAVVPDGGAGAAAPTPPTMTPIAPIDPQAPLVLTEPRMPHAVEDPAETAKAPETPPKPKPAKKDTTSVRPADPATAQATPGAAVAGSPGDTALAAIPAVPRAGVPSYFIDSFRIPVFLLPILQAAGTEYGVRWEILAAINEIETDYGRNLNVSSAGATGWMQFMPATWAAYGVDANRDGSADPYNPVDAIFAAARYLQAAGAQTDLLACDLRLQPRRLVRDVRARARAAAGRAARRPRRRAHRPRQRALAGARSRLAPSAPLDAATAVASG